ncbi:MAG: DNA polymerase III subunit delta [Chitinispirillaceae bacterium]
MSEITELSRLVILTGDDSIGKERARSRFIEQVKAVHGQCSVERFDSSAEEFCDFLQKMITPSLFQEIRVFSIGHAQTLPQTELEELGKLLKHEIPDVFVIMEAQPEKKGMTSAKLAKILQLKKLSSDSSVSIQDLSKPPDYKLAAWLTAQVPVLFNRKINKADAEFLLDLVGNDLDSLYSELQKIDINLPPRAPVDKSTIEEITGASRTMTAFELASALGEKNFVRALEVLESLFSSGFYVPMAVSALFRHFWALLRIRKYIQKNPGVMKQFNTRGYGPNSPQTEAAFSIGKASGLLSENDKRKTFPVIIQSGIVNQARNFSDADLKEVLKMLQELDVGVKTGRIDPVQHVIQMFCYRIVRISECVESGVYA